MTKEKELKKEMLKRQLELKGILDTEGLFAFELSNKNKIKEILNEILMCQKTYQDKYSKSNIMTLELLFQVIRLADKNNITILKNQKDIVEISEEFKIN